MTPTGHLRYSVKSYGLRALAVVLAVLFLAGIDTFRDGLVGVDACFVISGYLIAAIMLSKKCWTVSVDPGRRQSACVTHNMNSRQIQRSRQKPFVINDWHEPLADVRDSP